MFTVSHLEMGCKGLQVLEIQETQEWETRLASILVRNRWHPTLRWERNLQHQASCRFLEGGQTKKKAKVSD